MRWYGCCFAEQHWDLCLQGVWPPRCAVGLCRKEPSPAPEPRARPPSSFTKLTAKVLWSVHRRTDGHLAGSCFGLNSRAFVNQVLTVFWCL